MMVPQITSDGLEAVNVTAMMTASSFSCLWVTSAFHPDVTSGSFALTGLRSASCRHSDCLRSETLTVSAH